MRGRDHGLVLAIGEGLVHLYGLALKIEDTEVMEQYSKAISNALDSLDVTKD